jgi:hypothetical protein
LPALTVQPPGLAIGPGIELPPPSGPGHDPGGDGERLRGCGPVRSRRSTRGCADGPGWYPNICSHTISAVGTWEADAPAYSRPIAAPLERCAELLGVDLTTVRRATASIEPYIRVDGTRSGASCNWSDASGPRHTGESAAATSAVDGVHQSTARPESAWKVQRKGWCLASSREPKHGRPECQPGKGTPGRLVLSTPVVMESPNRSFFHMETIQREIAAWARPSQPCRPRASPPLCRFGLMAHRPWPHLKGTITMKRSVG